ncbi:MAG: hypothetical protein MIO92_07720, partial [Methanosarcinaceae archaeon]|nr:hypothetical protein [Methanosarcinaceae archaeon]
MQFDDDEIYFKCPNCPTTYDFTQFHELEHKSQADPSEGPDALGHAKCRNCAKEFYYYLTSDAYPLVVENDPPPNVPPDFSFPPDTINPSSDQPDPELISKFRATVKSQEKQPDRMTQFEQALNNINKSASPPERNRKISKILEIIVPESPSQREGALALLKRELKLNAREIEAFRKELNRKPKHKETDKTMEEVHAAFSLTAMPSKKLSEEEKQEAIEYLKDPKLFENISRDIAIAGEVVGEETNKMMLYLAATSRKFKKPISLVIFGKSSSGKSYLANAIEKFMPEEDIHVFSSVSKKALEYAGEQLLHKCILIQEWEGLEEALSTIRTLQSEGKLNRYVTGMDPISKTRKPMPNKMECPCSVIVTTTKEGIHDENSTRIFELYADESLEQTKNVVEHTLRRADRTKRISQEKKTRILDLHHNVQRMLQSVYVSIPFGEDLSFPAKTTRHRRDSDRFINLIKTVAFLRQMQKEKKTINGVECIDADLDDYRIAYDIGMDIIRATLNTISNRAKNALTVCCELND